MMRLVRTILPLLFICCILNLDAQDPKKVKKSDFMDHLVYGGDVILSISNFYTAVGGTPFVGYKVGERYMAGLGFTYIYISAPNYKDSNYGPRIFNRFAVTYEIFLHAEYEYLSFVRKWDSDGSKFKSEFPALLVGGGYRQEVGAGAYLSFALLYDVLQDPNSPYNGLIYRGGISIGF